MKDYCKKREEKHTEGIHLPKYEQKQQFLELVSLSNILHHIDSECSNTTNLFLLIEWVWF